MADLQVGSSWHGAAQAGPRHFRSTDGPSRSLASKASRRASALRARARPLGLPSLRSAVMRARPAARRRRTD